MSRRHSAIKKIIKPDNLYNSELVSKFVNNLMKDGKKSIAYHILYKAFQLLKTTHGVDDPLLIFTNSLNNVFPQVEVVSVRIGGANYQVPSPVNERRGYTLATRWLIESANKRAGRSIIEKLAEELFDAYNKRGNAIKKRENTQKMAEANKAFAHFAQTNIQR